MGSHPLAKWFEGGGQVLQPGDPSQILGLEGLHLYLLFGLDQGELQWAGCRHSYQLCAGNASANNRYLHDLLNLSDPWL